MSLKTRGILVLVIGTVLGVSLSLGGGILAGRNEPAPRDLAEDQARLLAEVMDRVRRDYVEPVDDAVLLENAIRGMVGDLDRHSAYLDADEYRDIRISTSGQYSGVGLEIGRADGRLLVISPIDGTPAQRAGIEAGDEIIEVDGQLVGGDGVDATVDRLRGRAGTPVSIRVQRAGYDDTLRFELVRQKIQVASVRHELLDGSVGYLRVSQFNDTTPGEASLAIDELIDASQAASGHMLTGLILDLRNNPGGILDAAVDVSDLFLDEGVIVSAEGRTPESRFTRIAEPGDVLDGAIMAVLVNGGSASGSEIVAGALQDHHRATIIGTQTFGKGLVQTVMPLSRGRAIKLTTSRYFTPSGDSSDATGVTPDVVVEGERGYPDQGLHGVLDREHDAQLIEALELIRGEPVMHSRAAD